MRSIQLFLIMIALSLVNICYAQIAANPTEQLFSQLKVKGLHLENYGAICEEAAIIEKQKQFAKIKPIVISGVEYADTEGIVGELDVLVIDRKTNQVLELTEVKCYENLAAGLKKAKAQSDRFFTLLKAGIDLYFYPNFTDEPALRPLERAHFTQLTRMRSLGQKGAVAGGYDEELPYSLAELTEVRKKIMACQEQGDCPRAR